MEKNINKILLCCVNNNLDLRTFEQSKEYKHLITNLLLSEHLGSVYSGLPIIIDGDLESIIISKKNEIALIILYDLVGREKRYVRVIYDSDFYGEFIRKELIPMTHIRLTARYTKNFGEYKGGDIKSYNKPLMYGHYVCPVCGYDYGTDKEHEDRCCEICADEITGRLKYVTDF